MVIVISRIQNISFLNASASNRLSIHMHWSHNLHILCGYSPIWQILFAEVTTSPFASVGQGLTSCDDLLRMCHCHHRHFTQAAFQSLVETCEDVKLVWLSDYGSFDLWVVVEWKRAQWSEEIIITHGRGAMGTELQIESRMPERQWTLLRATWLTLGQSPKWRLEKWTMTPGGRSEVKDVREVKSQEGSAAGSAAGRIAGNLAGSIAGRSIGNLAGRIAGAQPGRHKEWKEAERDASHANTKIMNIEILKPGMPEILKSGFGREAHLNWFLLSAGEIPATTAEEPDERRKLVRVEVPSWTVVEEKCPTAKEEFGNIFYYDEGLEKRNGNRDFYLARKAV